MRSVRFVTKGLPIGGVNNHMETVNARQGSVTRGIDIYFENDSRRYRLDSFDARPEGVVLAETHYVHESRVDLAIAWGVADR